MDMPESLTVPSEAVQRFAVELNRRRFLVATGGAALASGMLKPIRTFAQGTPTVEEEDRITSLIAVSKTLCGGGSFAMPNSQASDTATVILLFWYTGYFAGSPIPNRSTLAYQLTSWQAMYTPPVAVCKAFGGWANAPQEGPLQPANS